VSEDERRQRFEAIKQALARKREQQSHLTEAIDEAMRKPRTRITAYSPADRKALAELAAKHNRLAEHYATLADEDSGSGYQLGGPR
jgi:hypothetical protein